MNDEFNINFKTVAWVIFLILVGYSMHIAVSYKDTKAIYDYTNMIIERNNDCQNNLTNKVPLYREITDTGINLTILVENNNTFVQASLI